MQQVEYDAFNVPPALCMGFTIFDPVLDQMSMKRHLHAPWLRSVFILPLLAVSASFSQSGHIARMEEYFREARCTEKNEWIPGFDSLVVSKVPLAHLPRTVDFSPSWMDRTDTVSEQLKSLLVQLPPFNQWQESDTGLTTIDDPYRPARLAYFEHLSAYEVIYLGRLTACKHFLGDIFLYRSPANETVGFRSEAVLITHSGGRLISGLTVATADFAPVTRNREAPPLSPIPMNARFSVLCFVRNLWSI